MNEVDMLTNGSRLLQRKPQVPEIKNKNYFFLILLLFRDKRKKNKA
jgi:hypothetical protein